MISSRWRSAPPVTVSNFCASPPSAWIACSIEVRSRDSAFSKAALSSFRRCINSFMPVRWRSWRPSTNSARAMAASATDSMRLAWRSSSTAAACGRVGGGAGGGAEAGCLRVERGAGGLELGLGGLDRGFELRRASGHGLAARAAASLSEPATASMRSRSAVRRAATASPRTSARAPASSSAAIWFSSTLSRARSRRRRRRGRIERVKLAAHGAAQARRGARRGLVGGKQAVGGLGQVCEATAIC